MDLCPVVALPDGVLADFARRHGVVRLSLFGSALRDDFGPQSDIDLLVEFEPGRTPGLFGIARMEQELERALRRRVDLRTYRDLSRYFRDSVIRDARLLYAA